MSNGLERCPFCGLWVETACDSPPPTLCSQVSEHMLRAKGEVKPDPFTDIRNKRIGELNEEQTARATELWMRQNIGPQERYWYALVQQLFAVIDRLRADRDAHQWQPMSIAPKDNNRPLYLARIEGGKLLELDFDGGWEYWQESHELPHINGYAWVSEGGIEEPTHWAYQDLGAPPPVKQDIALREWAVARWRAEVEQRPLTNVHRRSLDDAWRQVMRYAGLDPDEVVGPSHDALLAQQEPKASAATHRAFAGSDD